MQRVFGTAAVLVLAMGVPVIGQDSKPPQPAPAEKPAESTGQEAQQDLPAADSLFEKHIAAVGGLEAMKAERNRLVRAKFTAPGGAVEGSLRVIRVAPNKMARITEIPGVMTQEVWFNGEDAWVRDTEKGTRRMQGEELAEAKFEADILGDCNYKARYREVKTMSREKFAGIDAFSVKATTPEGKVRTLYFDATAGFIIGVRSTTKEGAEALVVMSDYKKFGETLHPAKSAMSRGGFDVGTITITQIDTNLSVPPTVNPPDEVRAVK